MSKVRNSSSGQAVIEYILMLVVIVAIFLGLMAQFGTPFRDWAKNYFGEYLACVIETGELPSLGGAGGVNHGECNESFQAFTLGAGRPPNPNGAGGGSDSGDRSGGDGDKQNKTRTLRRIAAGTSGGGSGGSSGRGSSIFPAGQRGKRSSSGRGGVGAGGGRGEKTYTGSTESSLPSWATGRKKRIKVKKLGQIDNRFGYQTKREKEKEERAHMKVKKNKKDKHKTNKKMLITRKLATKKTAEDEDVSFTIGGFIKYILIIGIIIFLLIFLGGEVMNINKSMD